MNSPRRRAPAAALVSMLALAAFVAPPAAAPAPAASTASADSALDPTRAALGWDTLAGSQAAVVLAGSMTLFDLDGTFEMVFDGKGRLVLVTAGGIETQGGFDGTVTWERSYGDAPRTLDLVEHSAALLLGWLRTGEWIDQPDGLVLGEPTPSSGGAALMLPFTLDERITGTIVLDADTRLPRGAQWVQNGEEQGILMGDWKHHDGLAVAHDVSMHSPGGSVFRTVVESVERVPEVDDARFAARLAAPTDVRFDADVPAALEVRRAPTGHLLVHPRVDGKDVGWFILDTGAGGNCIAKPAARELGLERYGSIPAKGVGGYEPSTFARAETLTIGPLTQSDPIFIELDLGMLDGAMGGPVGGILGYDLFVRSVAAIDMERVEIALHDPRTFELDGGEWQELSLYNRHPCVRATFEDHTGVFKIDTGAAADTVTLHADAVERLALLDGRETWSVQMGGVGGSVSGRGGKLSTFELGGHRFEDIVADFATTSVGAFGDDATLGNIGGRLLAPFTLVLDYPGRRLALVPRPDQP